MDSKHAFDTINAHTFDTLLHAYPSALSATLANLDHRRLEVLPKKLKQRSPPCLLKDELATLVDWKLAHGKFRPTLKGLVQRNSDSDVQATTQKAFGAYSAELADHKSDVEAGHKRTGNDPIATLSTLSGVGPATASLLLSTYDPLRAPFFSDELFRWAFWKLGVSKGGQGWERKIKYNVHEYRDLLSSIHDFQARFKKDHGKDVSAIDVEKVAYVLGKRAFAAEPEIVLTKGSKRKSTAAEQGTNASKNATKTDALATDVSASSTTGAIASVSRPTQPELNTAGPAPNKRRRKKQ